MINRAASLLAALFLTVACEAGTSTRIDLESARVTEDSPQVEMRPVPARGVLAGLQQVNDCDVLLDYFVERALEQVGPWGLSGLPGQRWVSDTTAAGGESADDGSGSGQPGSEPSSTNVQVEGVDEGDIVKASGDTLYVLSNGRLLTFSIEDGTASELGRIQLDPEMSGAGQMLLDGDRLVLVSAGFDWGPQPVEVMADIAPSGSPLSHVALIDVSDPSAPKVLRRLTVDGSAVTTRLVGGHLRVVLEAHPVGLEFSHPEGSGLRAEREATERNREVIRRSTIENWLPYYVTDGDREGTLLDCGDVFLPPEPSGLGTLSILDFDLSTGIDQWSAAAVVASGSTVYATSERTYVATSEWIDPAAIEGPDAFSGHHTQIHRFDTPVDGRLAYVASGDVEGFLLNQFAMDEYEGDLRVASTTTPDWWGGAEDSQSRVTVLTVEGEELETIGSVDGLGVTETIRAVRFMGPVGYVVTFRQTDPLYVIDLSDPTDPVTAGELKIPGYSAYLHPLPEGRLLGVGQDADPETGMVRGLQVSLFDVSDPSDPRRLDTFGMSTPDDGAVERHVSSPIENDHKAFTLAGDRAYVPYEGWSWSEGSGGERLSLGVISVDWSGDTLDGSSVVSFFDGKTTGEEWGVSPQRTVVDGDTLYAIGHTAITVVDLATGEITDQVRF
jgi:hypothetical protein